MFSTALLVPLFAFAHTSDERYVDGYVVDLSTAPVAPWVGEKVGMDVTFRDPFSELATSTVVSATWEFDALMRASGKPAEIVYQSDTIPVVNGGFNMSHVFVEEGTYDLHLSFVDSSGKTHLTGFRKQVRNGSLPDGQKGMTPAMFLGAMLIVGLGMFMAGRLSVKK